MNRRGAPLRRRLLLYAPLCLAACSGQHGGPPTLATSTGAAAYWLHGGPVGYQMRYPPLPVDWEGPPPPAKVIYVSRAHTGEEGRLGEILIREPPYDAPYTMPSSYPPAKNPADAPIVVPTPDGAVIVYRNYAAWKQHPGPAESLADPGYLNPKRHRR